MKRLFVLCVAIASAAACSSTNYYLSPGADGAVVGLGGDGGNPIAVDGSVDAVPINDGSTSDAIVSGIAGLTVACNVPYILDGAKVAAMDQVYMAAHFAHLVQQYCVTGTILGADIAADPEKMYYGTHAKGLLGLMQLAMTKGLTPTYSVKFEFPPDSAAKTGSIWNVGVDDTAETARVAVYKYLTASQMCLFSIGTGGKLTFGAAQNTTAEGGSFSVSGNVSMTAPKDVPTVCDDAAKTSAPCCL